MIDITPYDQIVIGLSGGKDSTALMLWVRYESGWPIEKCRFVFCDTGNEDRLTYQYINLLSTTIHPIETIQPPRDFYEVAHYRQRFPASKTRFCTSELKIIPKHKMFAEMIDGGITPLNVTGIRNDEAHASNDRGDTLYLDYEQFKYGNNYYTLANANPLVKWTLDDVWNIHRKYIDLEEVATIVDEDPDLEYKGEILRRLMDTGTPSNPLYHMGASRVGCFPCINSRKREIRAMAKHRPKRVDFIREQEQHPAFRKGISTFFSAATVPQRFRSKKVVTKDGEETYVCTIDDVVLWSQTAWGGKQFEIDFVEEPSICRIGVHCE